MGLQLDRIAKPEGQDHFRGQTHVLPAGDHRRGNSRRSTRSGSDQRSGGSTCDGSQRRAESRSAADEQPVPLPMPSALAARRSSADVVDTTVHVERIQTNAENSAPFQAARGFGHYQMSLAAGAAREQGLAIYDDRIAQGCGEAVTSTIAPSVQCLIQADFKAGPGGNREIGSLLRWSSRGRCRRLRGLVSLRRADGRRLLLDRLNGLRYRRRWLWLDWLLGLLRDWLLRSRLAILLRHGLPEMLRNKLRRLLRRGLSRVPVSASVHEKNGRDIGANREDFHVRERACYVPLADRL